MPDIGVVAEVAGRVCSLPVGAGVCVSDGAGIAFEAMKNGWPGVVDRSLKNPVDSGQYR